MSDALYLFGPHHTLMLRLGYEFFATEISDSPIVAKDNEANFAIGYVYRF